MCECVCKSCHNLPIDNIIKKYSAIIAPVGFLKLLCLFGYALSLLHRTLSLLRFGLCMLFSYFKLLKNRGNMPSECSPK